MRAPAFTMAFLLATAVFVTSGQVSVLAAQKNIATTNNSAQNLSTSSDTGTSSSGINTEQLNNKYPENIPNKQRRPKQPDCMSCD